MNCVVVICCIAFVAHGADLDSDLAAALKQVGFTGQAEERLEARLGRPVDHNLADLGRLVFFDKITGLHSDNSCAGCHAPTAGFGGTQSIAIGVQNNNSVGPKRQGPRNQRRTPMLVNDAFFPKLMWNGRFSATSRDPFDNSQGFEFPAPEGKTRFQPRDPLIRHLLAAQAHIPPTELTEAAGFTGTADNIDPASLAVFDDGKGSVVPPPDDSGYRNEPIRQAVLERLNASRAYRGLFASNFSEIAAGAPIDFTMVGRAIAEFQFTLVFANAPVDRFARGERTAMTDGMKRGAMLFLGKAGCVRCHAASNEMFSDFENYNIGVPQIAPFFGFRSGNVIFDGPGGNEDFGAEQISMDESDRYKFRTAPLRNTALQPAFMHNGAFTRLEDAIRHHLDPALSARRYNPVAAGVAEDLTYSLAPSEEMLARLDPRMTQPVTLSHNEFEDLLEFVRDGLLDARARPQRLCALIPAVLPSGMPLQRFQGCQR